MQHADYLPPDRYMATLVHDWALTCSEHNTNPHQHIVCYIVVMFAVDYHNACMHACIVIPAW